ncbi:MAG TPA: hypothetical protein VNZ58_12790 [Thermomicrobiales bacterium]|nr:hypothetical protein [Thermomicrobiales bacterium]
MRNLRTWIVRNWIWLLVASLAIRLVLAPLAWGFLWDMYTYGDWAEKLVNQPFYLFYKIARNPDHLPGDMYLHAALGWSFHAVGGQDFQGPTYRFLLKVVPSIADTAVAILIWSVVRRQVNEECGRLAAVFYALNPATIFLTAIWGQWDVVSGLFLLAGLAIVWRWPERWLLSIPVFAWMVLIKPPLALLALIGLLVVPIRDIVRGATLVQIVRMRAIQAAAALAIGLGTITLLLRPFSVSISGTGTRWSLFERVQYALDLYPYTTLGAANIWMIPLGIPDRISDTGTRFLGVTLQGWGNVLFLAALVYIGAMSIRSLRKTTPIVLTVWAISAANYAWFLLPTRAHERYLFPTVLFLILLSGLMRLERRTTSIAAAVSLVYFVNLVGVYYGIPGWLSPVLFIGASLANIALFVAVAAMPFWWDDENIAQAEGTPLPVYAEDVVGEMIEAGGATG